MFRNQVHGMEQEEAEPSYSTTTTPVPTLLPSRKRRKKRSSQDKRNTQGGSASSNDAAQKTAAPEAPEKLSRRERRRLELQQKYEARAAAAVPEVLTRKQRKDERRRQEREKQLRRSELLKTLQQTQLSGLKASMLQSSELLGQQRETTRQQVRREFLEMKMGITTPASTESLQEDEHESTPGGSGTDDDHGGDGAEKSARLRKMRKSEQSKLFRVRKIAPAAEESEEFTSDESSEEEPEATEMDVEKPEESLESSSSSAETGKSESIPTASEPVSLEEFGNYELDLAAIFRGSKAEAAEEEKEREKEGASDDTASKPTDEAENEELMKSWFSSFKTKRDNEKLVGEDEDSDEDDDDNPYRVRGIKKVLKTGKRAHRPRRAETVLMEIQESEEESSEDGDEGDDLDEGEDEGEEDSDDGDDEMEDRVEYEEQFYRVSRNFDPAARAAETEAGDESPPNMLRKTAVFVDRLPEIQRQRLQLPVCSMEQEVMEAIQDHDVTIICGETGSGKTTQVPQFLYEAGFSLPGGENPGMIGVTQPRRVAAVSTCQRVAEELNLQTPAGETGGPVAYQIRYDNRVGPDTRIKFMTDGILLKEIQSDFLLRKYSVIILDEAHERGANTDVLIGVLSRIIRMRRQLAFELLEEREGSSDLDALEQRHRRRNHPKIRSLIGGDSSSEEDDEEDGFSDRSKYTLSYERTGDGRSKVVMKRVRSFGEDPGSSEDEALDAEDDGGVPESIDPFQDPLDSSWEGRRRNDPLNTAPPPPGSLRVVIMSATLRVSDFLGNTRLFPSIAQVKLRREKLLSRLQLRRDRHKEQLQQLAELRRKQHRKLRVACNELQLKYRQLKLPELPEEPRDDLQGLVAAIQQLNTDSNDSDDPAAATGEGKMDALVAEVQTGGGQKSTRRAQKRFRKLLDSYFRTDLRIRRQMRRLLENLRETAGDNGRKLLQRQLQQTCVPPIVVEVPARQYPVTSHFSRRTSLRDYVHDALKKVIKIHTRLPRGGILVFLTGRAEIRHACDSLQRLLAAEQRMAAEGRVSAREAEGSGEVQTMSDDEDNDPPPEPKNPLPASSFERLRELFGGADSSSSSSSLSSSSAVEDGWTDGMLDPEDDETMPLPATESDAAKAEAEEKDRSKRRKLAKTQPTTKRTDKNPSSETGKLSWEEEKAAIEEAEADVHQKLLREALEMGPVKVTGSSGGSVDLSGGRPGSRERRRKQRPSSAEAWTAELEEARKDAELLDLLFPKRVQRAERETSKSLPSTQEEGEGGEGHAGHDGDAREKSGLPSQVRILPLYSLLPPKEQMRVFETVPEDTRLIVFATNVAETSLTIPGIRYVVDSGRQKRRVWDQATGASSFQVGWISKASASQRQGRAGRTGPGHCYRLYSSACYESQFPDFDPPELLLSPIDSTILQMKALGIENVIKFPFPTPPSEHIVRRTVASLCLLGALKPVEGEEDSLPGMREAHRITRLGSRLVHFPVLPRFAKMLWLAAAAFQSGVSDAGLQRALLESYSTSVGQRFRLQRREVEHVRLLSFVLLTVAGVSVTDLLLPLDELEMPPGYLLEELFPHLLQSQRDRAAERIPVSSRGKKRKRNGRSSATKDSDMEHDPEAETEKGKRKAQLQVRKLDLQEFRAEVQSQREQLMHSESDLLSQMRLLCGYYVLLHNNLKAAELLEAPNQGSEQRRGERKEGQDSEEKEKSAEHRREVQRISRDTLHRFCVRFGLRKKAFSEAQQLRSQLGRALVRVLLHHHQQQPQQRQPGAVNARVEEQQEELEVVRDPESSGEFELTEDPETMANLEELDDLDAEAAVAAVEEQEDRSNQASSASSPSPLKGFAAFLQEELGKFRRMPKSADDKRLLQVVAAGLMDRLARKMDRETKRRYSQLFMEKYPEARRPPSLAGAYECNLISGPVFLHPSSVILRSRGSVHQQALPDYLVFTELFYTSQPLMDLDRMESSSERRREDDLMQDDSDSEAEDASKGGTAAQEEERGKEGAGENPAKKLPSRVFLRGCSVVRPEWISRFAPPALIKESPPLANPGPQWNQKQDRMLCAVESEFLISGGGQQLSLVEETEDIGFQRHSAAWSLPLRLVPFPENYLEQEAREFSRCLLEGAVFPKLQKIRPWLGKKPNLLLQVPGRSASSSFGDGLPVDTHRIPEDLLVLLEDVEFPIRRGRSSSPSQALLSQPELRQVRQLLQRSIGGPTEVKEIVSALMAAELWFQRSGAVEETGIPRLMSKRGLTWIWLEEPRFLLQEVQNWLTAARRNQLALLWPITDEKNDSESGSEAEGDSDSDSPF